MGGTCSCCDVVQHLLGRPEGVRDALARREVPPARSSFAIGPTSSLRLSAPSSTWPSTPTRRSACWTIQTAPTILADSTRVPTTTMPLTMRHAPPLKSRSPNRPRSASLAHREYATRSTRVPTFPALPPASLGTAAPAVPNTPKDSFRPLRPTSPSSRPPPTGSTPGLRPSSSLSASAVAPARTPPALAVSRSSLPTRSRSGSTRSRSATSAIRSPSSPT